MRLIFFFLLFTLFLASCGEARGSLPIPAPAPADALGDIANLLLWCGSIASALGLGIGALGFFGFIGTGVVGAILKVVSPFAGIVGWIGLATVGIGLGFGYVAQYPWLGAIAIILAFVARYLVLHPRLGGRFLAWFRDMSHGSKVKVNKAVT